MKNKTKKELISLIEKKHQLNQELGIFVIELLIKLSRTNEFSDFVKKNSELINNINKSLSNIDK